MSLFRWISMATPSPNSDFDPTTVTPGWVGFLAIFFIAVATVFLIFDMVRRIRRVRYREEIRAKLDAEATADSAADAAAPSDVPNGPASRSDDAR